MAAASKLYLKEIYQRFSYLAAWLPNINLTLGDVGLQQGDQFKQMTTLQSLGVPFKVRKGANAGDFIYTSQSGIALKPGVAGEVAVGTLTFGGVTTEEVKEELIEEDLFEGVEPE